MAHDVFISYSSIDKVVADTVVATLEKNNIRCWYAPRDIKPGSDWGEEIAKAVNSASVFLLIFSDNSNQSQRVLDELNLAISNEAAIIPFRIENLNPSGAMQLHLSTRHWLDAFSPSWETHLEKLFHAVSSNLEKGDGKESDKGEKSFVPPAMPSKKRNSVIAIIVLVVLVGIGSIYGLPMLLNTNVANDQSATEIPIEPTKTPTSLPIPTITPTLEPTGPALGTEENPIIWMYVPSDEMNYEDLNIIAEEVVQNFEVITDGLVLKFLPATTEASIVEAICDGQVHIGSFSALPYLLASRDECAEVKLIWTAFEDIKYGGEIFYNSSGEKLDSYEDLDGKTLCIPDLLSKSGWVLPSLEIRAIFGDPFTFFGEVVEMGSHYTVLESVYNGVCEVGTAYDDIRKDHLDELPGVMEIVEVVSTTVSMPQLNVSFLSGIDPNISQQLVSSLITMSSENDRLAVLLGFSNPEEQVADRLVEVNDYYYDELRDLFERAGENIEDYQ